ncbi:hypothetical protein GCM10027160_01650 [Streptomyces calidiresistens]
MDHPVRMGGRDPPAGDLPLDPFPLPVPLPGLFVAFRHGVEGGTGAPRPRGGAPFPAPLPVPAPSPAGAH